MKTVGANVSLIREISKMKEMTQEMTQILDF